MLSALQCSVQDDKVGCSNQESIWRPCSAAPSKAAVKVEGCAAHQIVVGEHFPVALEAVLAGGHMPQPLIRHAGARHVSQLLVPKLLLEAVPSCKSHPQLSPSTPMSLRQTLEAASEGPHLHPSPSFHCLGIMRWKAKEKGGVHLLFSDS